MSLAIVVDNNSAAAIAVSQKLVDAVQHTSGPNSINYLTKLCNHCNFRLDQGYAGKDLVEDAQKAAKLAETIFKEDNTWKSQSLRLNVWNAYFNA